jgi:hypothetical protein
VRVNLAPVASRDDYGPLGLSNPGVVEQRLSERLARVRLLGFLMRAQCVPTGYAENCADGKSRR